MVRIILVALALSLPASFAQAEPLIVDHDRQLAAALEPIVEQTRALHDLARTNDASGLQKALVAIRQNESLGPVARNHLLDQTLQALSLTAATRESRELVQAYIGHPVEVFIRHSEEHRSAVVPLYDLSATAALTLRVWDERKAAEIVAGRLRRGNWQSGSYLVTESSISLSAWQRGSVQALSQSSVAQLTAARGGILASMNSGEQLGPAALVAGIRLHDTELLRAVIARAQQKVALDAIQSATQVLPPAEAYEVLNASLDRMDVASAAILGIGSLLDSEPQAYDRLLQLLQDHNYGAAAALAFARNESPRTLTHLRALILSDSPQTTRLRAALALRLSATPAARSLQAELRDTMGIDTEMREALQ